ncbi:MAG: hypothetical protein H5T68_06665 [Chloroflexi bacterium]|nr:hypothetical protein [Chloroflexota bacterium]
MASRTVGASRVGVGKTVGGAGVDRVGVGTDVGNAAVGVGTDGAEPWQAAKARRSTKPIANLIWTHRLGIVIPSFDPATDGRHGCNG